MAVAVLVLEAVFFAVAFGFRTVVQLRTTGDKLLKEAKGLR